MQKTSPTSAELPKSLFHSIELDLFVPSSLRIDLTQLTSELVPAFRPFDLNDDCVLGVFHPPKV
jgi:hypothetical protein